MNKLSRIAAAAVAAAWAAGAAQAGVVCVGTAQGLACGADVEHLRLIGDSDAPRRPVPVRFALKQRLGGPLVAGLARVDARGLEWLADAQQRTRGAEWSVPVDADEQGPRYVYAVFIEDEAENFAQGAMVEVSADGRPLRRLTARPGFAGRLWIPYVVASDGQLFEADRYVDVSAAQAAAWLARFGADDGYWASAPAQALRPSREIPALAQDLNAGGEHALRRHRHDDAEVLFREAIGHAPDYARAHANLALALAAQDHVRAAEAENRAALALASGAQLDAALAAGAHFNLGRLAERDGSYGQAALEYHAADALWPAPVYGEAIAQALARRDSEAQLAQAETHAAGLQP